MMTGVEKNIGFLALGMSMGGHLHVNFATRMLLKGYRCVAVLLLLVCMVLLSLPWVQHNFISPTSHHLYRKWSQVRSLRHVVLNLMFLYHKIVL